jgi:two-component system chemotaxis response regulator CheY
MNATTIKDAIENLVILVADASSYNRRLTRAMLVNSGAKSIYEVGDGVAALDAIRNVNPDVMVLTWDLPGLDGPEVMRIVRSPEVFPKPNLPIIMISDTGQRSRVIASIRLGAHELLVRPISPKALQQRLLGILLHPRPMVHAGRYYIPLPRRPLDHEELMVAA